MWPDRVLYSYVPIEHAGTTGLMLTCETFYNRPTTIIKSKIKVTRLRDT